MSKVKGKQEWWAPLRAGLFSDPTGKHYKRMGPALWLYGYLHIGADWKEGTLERKYETIHNHSGIPTRNLQRMMKRLEKFGYVEVTRKAKSMVISITKWRPITPADNGGSQKVIRHFCPSDPPLLTSPPNNGGSQKPSKQKPKVPSPADNGGSNESPLSKPKDIYRIFKFWNDQKITVHREFKKYEPCIKARLKLYSLEEITQAIKNYKDILESPDHFFTYEWTLDEFLTRKKGLDKFMDRAKAFKNFRNNGNGYKSQADHNAATGGVVI